MSENGPAPQLLTMDIQSADGRLRGNLAVPQGEMRLAELAFNVLPLDDRLVAMSERRYLAGGKAVSCTKGCGVCCRQLVPLSPPEAWMLADLVAGLPEPRRARVLERFATVRDAMDESGWKQIYDDRAQRHSHELAALTLAYFGMNLPCPFLEDESCSIHRVRPSICREYLVTSPASNCAELGVPDGPTIERIPISVRLSEALARLTARLLDQAEPELIPLTLALEWAADHHVDGQRRWPGRALLEGLLAELSRPAAPAPP